MNPTQTTMNRLDYRNNLIVDKNNPILIQKAWRDHFSDDSHWNAGYGGEAYLGRINSEDALTWNTFRTLQDIGTNGLKFISDFLAIDAIESILFWGCDVETNNKYDYQILLNSMIRFHDGHFRGTMTEPDLVIITKSQVIFVECKLNNNGNDSPWKARSDGSKKKYDYYCSIDNDIKKIKEWEKVYQLIRNMFYSKQLSLYLSKTPVVITLVNDNHCPILNEYYQILLEHEQNIINDLKIFQDMRTWQQLSEMLSSEINLPKDRVDIILKKLMM